MKRILMLSLATCCYLLLAAQTLPSTRYGVAFYNLENLFDTLHDAGKND